MSSVDVITGEIVMEDGVLNAAEARSLTDRIRQTLTLAHGLITAAYTGRAWVALGYETWDAYCAGEFAEARMVRLDREQRREIVAEMRDAGMSTRAIASGIGVAQTTVQCDLPTEPNNSVEPVTGVNGKTYPSATPKATEPRPAPRRSLTDAFFEATYDLGKALDRVVRLTADDRFPRNAEQVAAKHRGDLLANYEALAGVLELLTSTGA